MKRLMKFGVILMALAVALAGCRTATDSSEAQKMTVTVRVVENLNLKHEFTLPNTDVATVKAGITAELNKFKTPGSPIPEDLTFNGISGYVFESGKYYSIGGTIALTDEQLLEVIKKGGIIIIRTDKL